jgi:hypothetical protein
MPSRQQRPGPRGAAPIHGSTGLAARAPPSRSRSPRSAAACDDYSLFHFPLPARRAAVHAYACVRGPTRAHVVTCMDGSYVRGVVWSTRRIRNGCNITTYQ